MSDFGEKLRQAREERGVSLRQIATSTKISMSALEALERGDFSRLPGGIFSRAFVRAFAIEIGLDPEEAVRSFLVEYERSESRANEVQAPEVSADDREFLERQRQAARILRAVLVGVVLLAVAAFIYWQVRRGGAAPADPAPARSETRPPAATPPPPAAAPVAPEDIRLALTLQVTASCWVQVNTDGADEPALQRVLSAGERQSFRAERELVLQVGNAGAVQWSMNGRVGKPLGQLGARVRLKLTRANYREFVQ